MAAVITVKPVPMAVGTGLPVTWAKAAIETEIPDFGGMLGDGQLEGAILELGHDRFRCVEAGDLDLAGLARLGDAIGGAGGREQVGTENTGQIRHAANHGLHLGGGLVGIVIVELGLENFDAGNISSFRP